MKIFSIKRIALAAWVIICIFCFNKFAYEIDQFNAATRIFLRTGSFDVRFFDEKGLPISTDVRTGRRLISPFYVVHYGLMHSETKKPTFTIIPDHWRHDPSVALWNVPPAELSEKQFKFNADWVVENIEELNGKKHLLYKFDWRYVNYPGGKLNAPWWSGLTDGYAIVLMLRAYDIYGEIKYLKTAADLYDSVTTEFTNGGSLIELNGLPWIEEYVDPRADPKEMSRVLNGMIYAYQGIRSYERKFDRNKKISNKLEDSIRNSIKFFSRGNWSYYDLIGNSANIKYHRIHVALLEDPAFSSMELDAIKAKWKFGVENPGYFWVLKGDWTPAKIHFLSLFLLFLAAPSIIIFFKKLRRSLHYENK